MINRAISAVLALVMLLTSGAMAVARGQAYDVAGQIVLCSGHGIVVVLLDAEGDPVARPHLCPDCMLSSSDPGAGPLPAAAPIRVEPVAFSALAVPAHGIARLPTAHARAPPASVLHTADM